MIPNSNSDTSIEYAKEMSSEGSYSSEQAVPEQANYIDDTQIREVQKKIDDLNKQAWYARDSDVLEARAHSKKAKKLLDDLAEQNKPYHQGLALYLKVSAFLIFRQREFEEALTTAFAALKLYIQLEKTDELAKVYSTIAIIYIELGDFVHAYTYLLKQLNNAQEYGDQLVAASALHDIGLLYNSHTENTTLALKHFDEAQEQFETLNNGWGACITKANKSALYTKTGNYDKALSLATEALDYGVKYNHDTAKCYAYYRLGCIHAALENHTEAIAYLNQALILSKQLSYDEISAKALLTKAQLFLKSDDILKARELYNETLKFSETVHDNTILQDCYVGIANTYKIEGDTRMALLTYESYIAANLKEKQVESQQKLRNIELVKTMETVRQDAELTKTQNVALVEKVDELNKVQQELYQLSTRDALTNLHNRRYAAEQLNIILKKSKQNQSLVCIALLDLDHFKSINDNFSHLIGDTVLKEIANILNDLTREIDISARFGGEEFLLILPNTPIKGAILVCERIRTAIELYNWENHANGLTVTASIGVAESTGQMDSETLIALADKLLYQSKENGRNKLTSSLKAITD